MNSKNNFILADGRWNGSHGIGRFSQEILSRLKQTNILYSTYKPLSFSNLFWLPKALKKQRGDHRVYFSPGFNPILNSPLPFVFSLHDLIHLTIPTKTRWLKKIYYETLIKKTAKQAEFIITGSLYSKTCIQNWIHPTHDNIVVINYGISSHFKPQGAKKELEFPYLLHVGNTQQPHKNICRLIQAFSLAKIENHFQLILTGKKTTELERLIKNLHLQHRIHFVGPVSEMELANYYRGATAVVFPSLMEGFGLPVAEGMACGIPVLTSNTTSLPEVAGSAALLINPYEVESIQQGIEEIVNNVLLRNNLIIKGLQQAQQFCWDKTANKIQHLLERFR